MKTGRIDEWMDGRMVGWMMDKYLNERSKKDSKRRSRS